ncbi:coiled-coil domain-containing protein [Acrasis kona]|uniref:Coiled-coil domain-containing protein n=1 Tax=Acrasis kona TaxID=1008807 RepID=A0AAW2ZKX6_9EUKA
MKFTVATLILTFITLITCAPSFPNIPNGFSAVVEVTENKTFYLTEYYNFNSKRARTDLQGPNDTHSIEVFYSDIGVHFTYDPTLQTCSSHVGGDNDERNLLIGQNGTLKIPTEIFYFGNQSDYTYIGQSVARGIECDMWKRVWNVTTSISYTIDYYFSSSNWGNFELDQEQVPVRIHIYGTFYNTSSLTTTTIDRHIEFVNFHSEAPQETVFDAPDYCSITYPPIAYPTLPSRFRLSAEMTFVNQNSTTGYEMWYDQQDNQFKFEYVDDNEVNEQYWDLKRNIHYTANRDAKTCQVTDPSKETNTQLTNQVFSPQQLFNFGENYTELYKGQNTIRGIRCDRWDSTFNRTYTRNNVDYTYQYTLSSYFSVSNWKSLGITNGQDRVPIRSHAKGTLLQSSSSSASQIEYIIDYGDLSILLPNDVFVPQSFCYNTLNPPRPPTPPQSFSALIEYTDVIQQTTNTLYYYWDYEDNRARLDVLDSRNSRLSIYMDAQKNNVYTYSYYNASAPCTSSNLSSSVYAAFEKGNKGHLKGFNDMMYFGPGFDNKYRGVVNVRGLDCDHWVSNLNSTTYPNGTLGDGTNLPFVVDHYFMAGDWLLGVGSERSRVPVRVSITAQNYQVFMEIIDYFPGTPSNDWFNVPQKCLDPNAQIRPVNGTRTKYSGVRGSIVGVASTFSGLGGTIIGSVAGFVACYFFNVRLAASRVAKASAVINTV